jgi:acetyl esterase/lipase
MDANLMCKTILPILSILFPLFMWSQTTPEFTIHKDILYYEGDDLPQDIQERCRLDVYVHEGLPEDFGTVVFFHAGGLKQGNKYIPGALRNKNYAVVGVNYRLHPDVTAPAYIEDAAAAVAWVIRNIETVGGDPDKVVLVGCSAGGYLASLITLDPKWLQIHDLHPDQLKGLASLSGQSITHFTVRKEQGVPFGKIVVDDLAPMSHIRKDAPPILLTSGDPELELFGRTEETAFFARMLKVAGHPDVERHMFPGKKHSEVEKASYPALTAWLERILGGN